MQEEQREEEKDRRKGDRIHEQMMEKEGKNNKRELK